MKSSVIPCHCSFPHIRCWWVMRLLEFSGSNSCCHQSFTAPSFSLHPHERALTLLEFVLCLDSGKCLETAVQSFVMHIKAISEQNKQSEPWSRRAHEVFCRVCNISGWLDEKLWLLFFFPRWQTMATIYSFYRNMVSGIWFAVLNLRNFCDQYIPDLISLTMELKQFSWFIVLQFKSWISWV